MKKGKIIVTQGLPSSGKSTWANDVMKKYPNTYIRVNKDELRFTLFGKDFDRRNENIIINVIDDIITQALNNNFDVIDDNTNFNNFHFKRYEKLFGERVEVVIFDQFLDVSIDECIERDSKRVKSVGKDVILKMSQSDIYKEYLLKKLNSRNVDLQIQSGV